ncbi:MAG: tRNA (adenosine(37)-N6)-threonylcarbamoyltransferase complex dimerization subunit type 1 TsaB [Clostridiales bacterium]|nr:tRNA (adenosine(37)-N6)-threonylcarbamoyltransferase complex dimerization subunit type 1 TsaB [Clostridiales bacterium]
MLIFACDTSLASASVCLIKDDKVVSELFINNNKKHAKTFMPLVLELFKKVPYEVTDVDYFAVSSGPGSFTGLRIGLSSVKAMAYALSKPMVMVPTLDVLAKQSQQEKATMCPMIDARNDQVYTAIYSPERQTDYMGIHIDKVITLLQNTDQKIILSGDGAKMHFDYLQSKLPNQITIKDEHEFPRASICGFLSVKYDKIEATEAVPFYLRPSQAERLFNK